MWIRVTVLRLDPSCCAYNIGSPYFRHDMQQSKIGTVWSRARLQGVQQEFWLSTAGFGVSLQTGNGLFLKCGCSVCTSHRRGWSSSSWIGELRDQTWISVYNLLHTAHLVRKPQFYNSPIPDLEWFGFSVQGLRVRIEGCSSFSIALRGFRVAGLFA